MWITEDGISTEHIHYAGQPLINVLTHPFNLIVRKEYVPINMHRWIQVPLFKGKNLDRLEVDNYRGIPLLTTPQRALYVQWTYIVRTVGTMYVQCTYIVRTVPAGTKQSYEMLLWDRLKD